MNEAMLRGYRRLVEAGRRSIEEVPEPYKTELLVAEGFTDVIVSE